MPQIVYYVHACAVLFKEGKLKQGEKINVVVPTGNFGNILAAYYAKQMGLPIDALICASNENKVLFDFFQSGTYDRNREFILTSSPSMDILISSNLERLVYRISGEDGEKNRGFMDALGKDGKYTIDETMREALDGFYGGYATQKEAGERIRAVYEQTGYVLDPHTAVASVVYEKYRQETGDGKPAVIASTASPFKFTKSVMEAICPSCEEADDFALADRLSEMARLDVPGAVEEIRNAPVRHDHVCEKGEMEQMICGFLQIAD